MTLYKFPRLGVTAQARISTGSVHEKPRITRVEFDSAPKVPNRLCPATLTAIDQPGDLVYLRIVWKHTPGKIELGAGAVVIKKSPIGIESQRPMDFSSIGLEADSIMDRRFGQLTAGGSLIVPSEDVEMQPTEHALRHQELWISSCRFIEQTHAFHHALIPKVLGFKFPRLRVKCLGDEIGGGLAFNGQFFGCRDFGAQPFCHLLCNLALNRKQIVQIAIVFFSPNVRVGACVDQLGI